MKFTVFLTFSRNFWIINLSTILFCLWVGGASLVYGAEPYPQRIVSLGPINTENVFLLGAGARLVGNTRYCVRPEAAREVEKIGSVMQISIEKIISLRPDLVLATALTREGQVRQLQAVGIKVVRFEQPESFEQICSQFVRLGRLLGLTKQAELAVDKARAEVANLQREISHLSKRKVFLQVGSRPLVGAAVSSFTNDFIVMAGGINIIEQPKFGAINSEKVIAKNPDVIIIAIMGSETGIAAQEKEKWQRFTIIKAVQEEAVHVINPNLVCSPSPATFVQALKIFAGFIHPETATEVGQ